MKAVGGVLLACGLLGIPVVLFTHFGGIIFPLFVCAVVMVAGMPLAFSPVFNTLTPANGGDSENVKHISPFSRLWVTWLTLTILYTLFNFAGFLKEGHSSTLGYVTGFVGLFVPLGPISSFLILSLPLVIPIIMIGLFFGEKWARPWRLSFWKSISYNLIVLLLITIAADFARLTPFASFWIFFRGALPHICC